jgi:SAM-dependent methyltransferase
VTRGGQGWDAYAPFYDWENARTFGRRDVAFWRRIAGREAGPLLELGCGTGRLLLPLARGRTGLVGLDRSAAMLERARTRASRLPRRRRPRLVRGDVRGLPFADRAFGAVLAPYGLLQSLLTDRDLRRALAEAARVLRRGGLLGIDLVPDLPAWAEYGPRVRLKGKGARGGTIALVESVRQDRRRGVTIFDERFTERRGGRTHERAFTLVFRTQPLPRMLARIERAGFRVEAVLGDYQGAAWTPASDAWLILARKPPA